MQHIPAIAPEAALDILAESKIRTALDRYPVGIVNPAQVSKTEVAG
jgi:hypothetical protein